MLCTSEAQLQRQCPWDEVSAVAVNALTSCFSVVVLVPWWCSSKRNSSVATGLAFATKDKDYVPHTSFLPEFG